MPPLSSPASRTVFCHFSLQQIIIICFKHNHRLYLFALAHCSAVQVAVRSFVYIPAALVRGTLRTSHSFLIISWLLKSALSVKMRVTSLSLPLVALILAGHIAAHPYPEADALLRRQSQNQARADAVKEAFQHAWNGYMKYAFPHDELHPVSNSYGDSR